MFKTDKKPVTLATGSVWSILCLLLTTSSLSAAEKGPGPHDAKQDFEEIPISAVEFKARSNHIRAHFAEKLKRQQVVATTVTRSGQTIDWIHPETQVPGGRLASPPPDDSKHEADPGVHNGPFLEPFLAIAPEIKQGDSTARTELQLDGSARGPEGTVPIVRFKVDQYLNTVELPPEKPSDVLQKLPPPALESNKKILPPAPASNSRYYAVWQRLGTFFGTTGSINIWDTSGPVGNETSIAQTAVIRGAPLQAIEAGKIENQSLNGNLSPHFFTYYRTRDSASGDWIGGYNTLVKGWIQYSSRVAPGMSITAWNSRTNGTQYTLDVEVRLFQGNWWVRVAGEWAGYYPYCIGGGAAPCRSGTLFSQSGIRDQASRLDWYGEVFDSSAPAATSTDMGSGEFANKGWQHAAYFRNLTFYWRPNDYWWWDSGSISVTDAKCYSANGPFYSSNPSWRNWYFYGGPGKEANGCI